MELIVAVYDDWGIGCCGTQPVALSADRKFFREMTRGAMVIVGNDLRKIIFSKPSRCYYASQIHFHFFFNSSEYKFPQLVFMVFGKSFSCSQGQRRY